jgi:hypothetical protein
MRFAKNPTLPDPSGYLWHDETRRYRPVPRTLADVSPVVLGECTDVPSGERTPFPWCWHDLAIGACLVVALFFIAGCGDTPDARAERLARSAGLAGCRLVSVQDTGREFTEGSDPMRYRPILAYHYRCAKGSLEVYFP